MKFDCEIDVSLHFTASRIRYEITSGNIGGAFAVKNMTGAIYVAGALDYETRKRVSVLREKHRRRRGTKVFAVDLFNHISIYALVSLISIKSRKLELKCLH